MILSFLAVIGLALAANALWLTEVVWKTGWDNSNWLWAPQNAIFGISALLVVSYLAPVALLKGISWKKLWMPGLELYFVAIIAFFLTKSILYSLFMPIAIFDLSPYLLWLMLAALTVTSAGSFFYLTRNHLYPVKPAFVPVMIGAELLVVVLSLLLSYLLLGRGTLEEVVVNAVKTGFPFFFITLLLGLFSILSIQKLPVREAGEKKDEILDDMML